MKKLPNYYLKFGIGREKNPMYLNKEFSPDYNPHLEYNKKRLNLLTPNFRKQARKKDNTKRSETNNEDFYNYDFYTKTQNSSIFRRFPLLLYIFFKKLNFR